MDRFDISAQFLLGYGYGKVYMLLVYFIAFILRRVLVILLLIMFLTFQRALFVALLVLTGFGCSSLVWLTAPFLAWPFCRLFVDHVSCSCILFLWRGALAW